MVRNYNSSSRSTRAKRLKKTMASKGLTMPHGYAVVARKKKQTRAKSKRKK